MTTGQVVETSVTNILSKDCLHLDNRARLIPDVPLGSNHLPIIIIIVMMIMIIFNNNNNNNNNKKK